MLNHLGLLCIIKNSMVKPYEPEITSYPLSKELFHPIILPQNVPLEEIKQQEFKMGWVVESSGTGIALDTC